jgi:PAS domain S-box-containing protein
MRRAIEAATPLSERPLRLTRDLSGVTRIHLARPAAPDGEESLDFAEFLSSTVLPEDAQRWREALDRSAAAMEPFLLEVRVLAAAGAPRWYRIAASPVLLQDGAVSWTGVALDLGEARPTARQRRGHEERLRQAEALLKARDREFRMVEEIAKLGHWASSYQSSGDRAGRRVRCSPGAAAIFGVAPAALEIPHADYLSRFVHPEDAEWLQLGASALDGQAAGRRSREYRIRRADGAVRWIHEVEEVLVREDGQARETAGIIQDITERKQAELALRERDERLHAALDVSRTSTYRWNLHTNEIEEDDSIHGLIGVPSGAIRNLEDYFTHVHPADRDALAAAAERSSREGTDLAVDYRVIQPDGSVLWVSERGRVFFDDHGRPLYMTGAVTDITDRKMFEEHQRLLLAELSHRVKNTLAVVHSIALQTLRRSNTLEAFAEAFKGRISALSRAHSLLTRSQWRSAGLEDLVRQTLAPYGATGSSALEIAGPKLGLRPKPALALALVLHELATNAAKYGSLSTPSGRLSVIWEASPALGLVIGWREAAGPKVAEPTTRGFGRTLIERAVAHELDGSVRFDYRGTGLYCEIRVPLTPELSADEPRGGRTAAADLQDRTRRS